MRAFVVFLISLSFLLLRGSEYVYAKTCHNRFFYSPAPHTEKTQPVKLNTADQRTVSAINSCLNEKKEAVITVEDDDDDFIAARKHTLLARYFITLAYASILLYFYSCLKDRLPFCRHLSYTSSYKYILQRVLRI